jgi:hypothetical protein
LKARVEVENAVDAMICPSPGGISQAPPKTGFGPTSNNEQRKAKPMAPSLPDLEAKKRGARNCALPGQDGS